MKLAIASDLHLGFSCGSEREPESYDNAEKAIQLALDNNADALLLPGDLFDSEVPKQEVLYKALQIFKLAKDAPKREVSLAKEGKPCSFSGLPVIAIHGTHEFRGKDYKNVLEILEKAGCLCYIHGGHALIEKGNEKVAVHGMGGVPEKKAKDVLQRYNPKPLPSSKNLLLLHQSIKEFLPVDDEMVATLSLEDLPKGFDLIVNGHLHWQSEINENGVHLIMPGSTIITQMKKLESTKEKGILIYDTENSKPEFIPLPSQRKFFYRKIKLTNTTPEQALAEANKAISEMPLDNSSLKPLVRLKLTGTLAKGFTNSDISLSSLEKEFSERALFSNSVDFSSQSFMKRISELREMQRSKVSIAEQGLKLFEKNLEEAGFKGAFDSRRIFTLLEDGRNDEAMSVLLAAAEK